MLSVLETDNSARVRDGYMRPSTRDHPRARKSRTERAFAARTCARAIACDRTYRAGTFMVSRASALSCHPLREVPSLQGRGRRPHLRSSPEPKHACLGLLGWNSYGTEAAQPVANVRL